MEVDRKSIEKQLLSIMRSFLLELDAERALQGITLSASLERDLGIDSLGKVELLNRIEHTFAIQFDESAIITTDSLADFIPLIQKARPHTPSSIPAQFVSPTIDTIDLDLSSARTLVDVLSTYASIEPARPHIYLQDEHGEEQVIRYGALMSEAKKIAAGLHQRGIKVGETVAIMLPTSDEFFYAFCGILLAGAIAVPIYPPFRPDRVEEYAKREAKILNSAQVKILITITQTEVLSNILRTFVPSLKEVVTIKKLTATPSSLPNMQLTENDFALIQYTSGSTSDPKGVLLAHKNILANIRAIGQATPIQPNDVIVSWLPLYHDMGLMNWLVPLYFGIPATILSPLTFLTRPERWLWAIHFHRATLSGGPNFAYELCAQKINLNQLQGLDLSSWRYAFNGAEAVNPKTLDRFYQKFSPFGFKLESFAPVYGLAESTVGLTLPPMRRRPHIDRIQRGSFEQKRLAIPALEDKDYLEFVACGKPLPDHFIRIVDDSGHAVADRSVGNIQFKGPSAMQGYFHNPAATAEIFHDGWWDTGDLGYQIENELFITGRKKDLIIKAGRNFHPEAIEGIVNQLQDVRKGCVIAFGVSDPISGTEKLIVVAETYKVEKETLQHIRNQIIENLVNVLGIPPDVVVLAPPRTVPKTSSGKLQRSACKYAYIKGSLGKPPLPIKLQLMKLACMSIYKKIGQWCSTFGKLLYSAYIGTIVLLTVPFIWLSLFLTPRHIAATVCRAWARIFCRLTSCPIEIKGETNLNSKKPVIFVANHASHFDSVLLLSLLPPDVIFIAKKELLHTPIIRTFIKKLGFITVDRLDSQKSLESKNFIEFMIKQQRSIAIFPEGTFTYNAGLRPFKLGAFAIAVATQTPICPIALHGTRAILRDGCLPRPSKIRVTVGIMPETKEWSEVTRLHGLARTFIAEHCGEPVIDIIVAGPTR